MKTGSSPDLKAAHITEALPYFRLFQGRTIVIKYGGAAQVDPALRKMVCEDLVLMRTVGIRPVLVHGGGPEISRMMEALDIPVEFVEGLRVTSEAASEVVEMVLVGKINKSIVADLNLAGGIAVGLSGRDGNLVRAEPSSPAAGPNGPVDLGRVGKPVEIRCGILGDLLSRGYIPVIAPTGMGPSGEMLNVNGDSVAGHIAAALAAEKLIFLTDQPGLLRDPNDPSSLIQRVHPGDLPALKAEGVIAGGMIPKVDAALTALDSDVGKVHILDGKRPHSLILELFTDEGIGTMISRR